MAWNSYNAELVVNSKNPRFPKGGFEETDWSFDSVCNDIWRVWEVLKTGRSSSIFFRIL